MTWLTWLGIAVVVAVFAALTGIKPKGTRHVSHTKLMGGARIVLVVIVVALLWAAYAARSAG
jgi:UDP-N-acetylmuramyl pentapeptide phosphotransferase/UDP-N-acetylglucosamine-1-phosphate transferase